MGIPGFFRALKNAGLIKDEKPYKGEVVSLAIDMNGMIHSIAAKCFGYEEIKPGDKDKEGKIERRKMAEKTSFGDIMLKFKEMLINELINLCQIIRPNKYFILCVDGVVPLAKIQQQRQRRFKSSLGGDNVVKLGGGDYFDRNEITVGTSFMKQVDLIIREIIGSQILFENLFPPEIIYSSHMVPGEGEHKIMQFYRDNFEKMGEREGAHVLYGLDSDLILLSLLSPLNNIILYRETLKYSLSINTLKSTIQEKLVKNRAIESFVIIMCLLGNDFIPRCEALENIEKSMIDIIDSYIRINGTIINENGKVDMRIFVTLLEKLTEIYKEQNSKESNEISLRMINYGRTQRDKLELKKLVYEGHSLTNDIYEMSASYLITIDWILEYYSKGVEKINIKWYYPYKFSPLISSLIDLCNKKPKMWDREISRLKETGRGISVLEQLLCVFPRNSLLNIIERKYYNIIISKLGDVIPIAFEIYKKNILDKDRYIALIPFASLSRVRQTLNAPRIGDLIKLFSMKEEKNLTIINEKSTLIVKGEVQQTVEIPQNFKKIITDKLSVIGVEVPGFPLSLIDILSKKGSITDEDLKESSKVMVLSSIKEKDLSVRIGKKYEIKNPEISLNIIDVYRS